MGGASLLKHTGARLIGASPGSVGFDQGGPLTDEIEKAHSDIFNILLQAMDHAALAGIDGKRADLRNERNRTILLFGEVVPNYRSVFAFDAVAILIFGA